MENIKRIFNKNPQVKTLWTLDFLKMFLIAVLIAFCTQFLAAAFPLYMRSLGGGLSYVGLATSIHMGTSMLFKPLVGRLLDKKNRKIILIVGEFCYAAIILSYGHIKVIPLILLARVINAPFYSASNAAASTIVTDIIPNSRLTDGLGYYNLSLTFAAALAPSLALMFIDKYSYGTLFNVASAFVAAAALIALTLRYKRSLPEPPQSLPVEKTEILPAEVISVDSEKAIKKQRWYEKMAERGAFLPASMSLLLSLGASSMITFLPTFGAVFNISNIGLYFTVQAITVAVSRMFIGKFSKKFGHTVTITISLIFISISLLGISLSRSLPPLLLFAMTYGLGSGAITPELHSLAILRTSKERRGSTNSIFQMAGEAGLCASSIYLGILADLIGIQYVFFIGMFFPIFALIVYYTMLRPKIIKEKI